MIKKSVLIGTYILVHIFVMRDVRNFIFSTQVTENLIERIDKKENLSINKLEIRIINIELREGDYKRVWHYRIPFGLFFFIAVLVLILMAAEKEFFALLIGLHFIAVVIASIIFNVGVNYSYWSLLVTDLLSRYLIPLCSLGICPIAMVLKKKRLHEG